LRAPLALVAAILYVLGAITGGSLFALLRKSIRESKLTGIR
jgi:putative membrane protein